MSGCAKPLRQAISERHQECAMRQAFFKTPLKTIKTMILFVFLESC